MSTNQAEGCPAPDEQNAPYGDSQVENRHYLLAAKARIIPSTTPKNAANSTPNTMRRRICL